MARELLVGLNVIDDERYRQYRLAMRPLLEGLGGGFGYDFRVSEVLISQTDNPINRVFTIHFPSREAQERFFGASAYLAIKAEFFEASVGATTILAEYDR